MAIKHVVDTHGIVWNLEESCLAGLNATHFLCKRTWAGEFFQPNFLAN